MTITAQAVLSHWKWPAVWNASSWSLSATDRDGDKSAGCGQLTLVLQTEKPNLQQSLTITRRCISQNFANCRKQCRNKLYNKSRTNQSNNKVMKLEGYSRPTCNKLCASSHVAFDRHRCNPQARPSMRFVDHTIDLPRWNFLSLDFWEKFQSEVPLFLEAPKFP